MAQVVPDPNKIKSFRSEAEFEKWLRANHDRETELWLKVHKKDSGLPSITTAQALDVALCWEWIDGLRKAYDEQSFLQRYSPRKARSIWSQINLRFAARAKPPFRLTFVPPSTRTNARSRPFSRWDA
jgi:uncharacterized protein YdeI (YjbR/CyaY-like superfamily)